MKYLLRSNETSPSTARPAKTFILAALAVMLVGCGGGDDPAPASRNTNSAAEQGVINLICFIVTLGQAGCLDNDGISPPDTSAATAPSPNAPGCHGPERCIEGSQTVYSEAFDLEPNDAMAAASVASFPVPHDPELHVGFFANGTINNLADGVDTYAFTATRSLTFNFRLCAGTFADGCREDSLDLGIAYFSVLDQFGTVLFSSQGSSGNYQPMHIDAGVLYYVMVIAEDTGNADRQYALQVSEAIVQPDPEVPEESEAVAPVLASPTPPPVGMLVTLDWMPPTMNVDGTPLMDLAGYNVYIGPESGVYLDFRHLDNPGLATYVLDLQSTGTWYIVITALDSAGNESDFSNEAAVSVICECDLPPPGEMP